MNWSKSKTILIVALLLTNLFLIYHIFTTKIAYTSLDEEIIAETLEMLDSNEIYIQGKIPQDYSPMPVLSVTYDENNGVFFFSTTKTSPTGDAFDEQSAEKAAKKFLIQKHLYSDPMVHSNTEKLPQGNATYNVTFKNIFNGVEIEGCYLTCTVENNRVTRLERFWLNPESYGKNKGRIIPATKALLKFSQDPSISPPVVITNIELVYYLDTTFVNADDTSSDTALPAWKISTRGGKQLFIPAFDQ